MSRPIVHATDFSPASRAAFAQAVEVARRERAPLTILHVMPTPPATSDGYVLPSTLERIRRAQRAASQKLLDAQVARARASGARATGVLTEGHPSDRIVRASRGARLLVIGTHGRTGLARFMLGSVAGRVIAGARCPVLTVRGGR
jgi:nucleotide-binding universal stress UspA family protein